MNQLEEIKARASAASAGPWDAAKGATVGGNTICTTKAQKAEFLALSLNDDKSPLWLLASDTVIPAATGDGPKAKANAKFIAASRTDVPKLVAALEAVEEVLTWLDEVAASDTSKRIATGAHVQAGGVASIIRNAITGALEAA